MFYLYFYRHISLDNKIGNNFFGVFLDLSSILFLLGLSCLDAFISPPPLQEFRVGPSPPLIRPWIGIERFDYEFC